MSMMRGDFPSEKEEKRLRHMVRSDEKHLETSPRRWGQNPEPHAPSAVDGIEKGGLSYPFHTSAIDSTCAHRPAKDGTRTTTGTTTGTTGYMGRPASSTLPWKISPARGGVPARGEKHIQARTKAHRTAILGKKKESLLPDEARKKAKAGS
ncbi:hypothetical protein LZ30DRAFT_271858 [Colletotrichum cereale]|nr:hypothetical protein LZ30DRAFT_271858 [Colletotrichum cereale]